MNNLKYSKQELKIFQQCLNEVLDDLIDLWNIGALNKISFPVELPGFKECDKRYTHKSWEFIMEEKGFYLYQDNECGTDYRYEFVYINDKNGKFSKLLEINEQDIIFLKHYPQIREQVVKKIKDAINEKNANLNMAKELMQKLNKEATIELELPPSINQHTIEVSEEDGRKIGTLNFGGIALKIITDAHIEFKNKNKEDIPVKRK